MAGRTFRVPTWAIVLAIFAITLLAYWPSLAGGVLWDDPAHLTRRDLQSWPGLIRILTQIGATQEFYPILHGAFWVEHRLWGETLPLYHLLNILLHAGSACLLALVLRRLWSPPPSTAPRQNAHRVVPEGAEWLAALLFAVHPVTVESVAWITEQKNTLSVFLFLLAAYNYLGYAERRRIGTYLVALGCFFLALGAKTATITLPPALLVALWWRQGRIEWRRDILPLVPWLALAVVAGLVTVQVETNLVGAKGADYVLTLPQRWLLMPRIVWFYVGKILWPGDLLFFYPRWNVPAQAAGWWGYLLATVAVTAAFWAVRRRTRGPLASWLIFLGVMFPVIGFLNVFAFVFSYVADHFQYMPCMTFIAAAAGGIALGISALPAWAKWPARLVCVVAVMACAAETYRLSSLYESDQTLFGHVVAKNPGSWMAHEILAVTAAKAGRSDEAMAQFREVLRLRPDNPDAHLGLGIELGKLPDRKAEAMAYYEDAVRLRPQYVEAHYNLGVALALDPSRRPEALKHLEVAVGLEPTLVEGQVALGKLLAKDRNAIPEALNHFHEALRFQPDFAPAYIGMADTLARLPGRQAEAISDYETALKLNPENAEAHYNLANTLVAEGGQFAVAIPHYEAAIRLKPNSAEAHANLASVLARLGRPEEALRHYQAALDINPGLASAHYNLALLLARTPGRGPEAIQHAEAAVRLNPTDSEMHNTLAIFYVQSGNIEQARAEWEKALQINPGYEDARKNLQRLEQMQAQQPPP